MGTRLPKRVTLPRLGAVDLRARGQREPREREPGTPLFSELHALVEAGDLVVLRRGVPVDPSALALVDFHTLRALATTFGLLAEDPIEVDCRNCEATLSMAPCASLATGPYLDGELDDPELDATLDLSIMHSIPSVRLLSGEPATSIRFDARTTGEAAALHHALRKRRFVLTADVVRAMGIVALGDETDAARIARALGRASERAWDAVTAHFLDAHYPLRLCGVALCKDCGARNDVDAPFVREFERGPILAPDDEAARSNAEDFPTFATFSARAEAIFHELSAEGSGVSFVIERDVAACDDGGEPLLGSYVPGFEGASDAPSRAPEVTVYMRTFRAAHLEEADFDWNAELFETIEHELEHHAHALVGHDPVDDEERAAIANEALRLHGRRAIARTATRGLVRDIAEFLRRTWPLWLLVALVTLAATISER